MIGGSSAEEGVLAVDADENSEWMMSCEDLKANWLPAKKAASSA